MTESHLKTRAVLDQPRGRPYQKGTSGNPAGRPPGSRNRTTLAAQALLDGEAEALTRKAIELALHGDLNALRLCLDRVLPPRREQPVEFELRKLEHIHDAQEALADLVSAVATGKITISESFDITRLIEAYVRACEGSQRWLQSVRRSDNEEQDREEARLYARGGMPRRFG